MEDVVEFDGAKVAIKAAKIARRADEARLLDTEDLEAFEYAFTKHVLEF